MTIFHVLLKKEEREKISDDRFSIFDWYATHRFKVSTNERIIVTINYLLKNISLKYG